MRINFLSPKNLLLAGLSLCAMPAMAQLHVTMTGDVGIGTTSPIAKLHVMNDVEPYTFWNEDFNTTFGYKYGIVNQVYSPKGGSTYGMYNYAATAYGANPPGWDYTIGQYNFTDGVQGTVQGIFNMAYQYDCAEGQGYGIFNELYTDSKYEAYGIYNVVSLRRASCASSNVYGIYNNTGLGNAITYGIYSSTAGAGNYAGYFDGNVHINGMLTVTSDERKKQDVTKLSGAMALVEQMNGYTYTFKDDANMNLPEGKQYGFLAQELEQVLPDLVADGNNPLQPADKSNEAMPKPLKKGDKPNFEKQDDLGSESFKAVNYIGVIPILVEAMKEQQAQLEAQRQEIQALRNELNKR
jgi:hypothetical protein